MFTNVGNGCLYVVLFSEISACYAYFCSTALSSSPLLRLLLLLLLLLLLSSASLSGFHLACTSTSLAHQPPLGQLPSASTLSPSMQWSIGCCGKNFLRKLLPFYGSLLFSSSSLLCTAHSLGATSLWSAGLGQAVKFMEIHGPCQHGCAKKETHLMKSLAISEYFSFAGIHSFLCKIGHKKTTWLPTVFQGSQHLLPHLLSFVRSCQGVIALQQSLVDLGAGFMMIYIAHHFSDGKLWQLVLLINYQFKPLRKHLAPRFYTISP